MKHFLWTLIVLGLFAVPAHATPITKDTANAYYTNCKATPDPRFSAQIQDTFCACTASQLMSSFTMEDMQNTARQDSVGLAARNKMIINIYAPCIQYPAKEYHYQTCIKDPKTKMLGNPQKVCACASNNVAQNLQQNSQSMFREILRTNPNIADPMQALYSDPKFQKSVQNGLMRCIL